MSNKKWYVVWHGKSPGIYKTWDDTKEQINGVSGAKFQSFKTEWAAKEAFKIGPSAFQNLREKVLPEKVWDSISVDAACGNPGLLSIVVYLPKTKRNFS